MNRMEEYEALCRELEQLPPETAGCVERAVARRNRRRRIWQPLGSIAAVFAVFVGLVNVSPAVSAACMEIPLLDKLTEAVTFSRSLQAAVEHNYVQPVGLEQTQSGVTVRVEHVIVDQKQVNVFYTVSSEEHPYLTDRPDVLKPDGTEPKCTVISGDYRVQLEQLRHVTIDFTEESVPAQLRLLLEVMEVRSHGAEPTNEEWDSSIHNEPLAVFDFLLTFDSGFAGQGRMVSPGQSFTLDGNTFTVAEIGVYPSQIRIQLEEAPENRCWINSLHFYLELEDGTIMERGSNGISAYGDPNTPSMTTYVAESSYFYDAAHIRLVITGADLLDKNFGRTYIDLEDQKAENLPAGWEFVSAKESADGWELEFLRPDDGVSHTMVFAGFYDEDGNQLETGSAWGTTRTTEGESGTGIMSAAGYSLKPFAGHEVWGEPYYSENWYAEEPVVVELDLLPQQD